MRYAGLPDDSPDYPLIERYMDGGKASSILSFGIEHIDDIIADLDQALAASG